MEQVLLDLIYSSFLIYLGWKLHEWHMMLSVYSMIKEKLEKDGIDLETMDIINNENIGDVMFLEVEKVNDMYLVYDKTSNEFICQGNTIDDAAVKFTERKEKTLGTFTLDEKILYFYNGVVKYDMPKKQ